MGNVNGDDFPIKNSHLPYLCNSLPVGTVAVPLHQGRIISPMTHGLTPPETKVMDPNVELQLLCATGNQGTTWSARPSAVESLWKFARKRVKQTLQIWYKVQATKIAKLVNDNSNNCGLWSL